MTAKRIASHLTTRNALATGSPRKHKLPLCESTGLPRYRDRHQAKDGAKARRSGAQAPIVSTFACPGCQGYHLEIAYQRDLVMAQPELTPTPAFINSLPTRKRRYFLVDIENLTHGAVASCEQVFQLWSTFRGEAPGIAPNDHVVVGAARRVVRKYRSVVSGPNVRWVVGADAADGADHALLAAIDLYRVASQFDELVIVSGDHAFASLARRAKAVGLSVHVVTTEHPEQRSMLSRELSKAANIRTRLRLSKRSAPATNLIKSPMLLSIRATQSATYSAAPRELIAA